MRGHFHEVHVLTAGYDVPLWQIQISSCHSLFTGVWTPLKKIESQLKWLFPIYGKIKTCSKPPTRFVGLVNPRQACLLCVTRYVAVVESYRIQLRYSSPLHQGPLCLRLLTWSPWNIWRVSVDRSTPVDRSSPKWMAYRNYSGTSHLEMDDSGVPPF